MDKGEAERLVRAIERTHVAWLQVQEMVLNPTSNADATAVLVPGTPQQAARIHA